GQRGGETVHKEDSAPSKAATAPSSQPSLMLSVEHNEKIKARNSTIASAATPTLPTPLPPGTLASSSSSVKMLARQESPMNPYNKFDYPKIPDELTPIESCSYCSVDTPNVDEAVRSTVIGSIGCCKETWKRKEFYYLAKARVERAVKRHKVFLIRGDLPMLSSALEQRGWVQKYECVKTRMLPYNSNTFEYNSKTFENVKQNDGTLNEKEVIFAFLRHTPPDFIWDCRNDFVEWDSTIKQTVVLNRFQKPSVYTSKLGMAHILQDAHWLYEDNVSSIQIPRGYNPSRESNAFLDDFRFTAAVGLLKWLVVRIQSGESIVEIGSESVPISRLEFAIQRCEVFLAKEQHDEIDELNAFVDPSEEEWRVFLDDYSRVVHKGNGIANSSGDISVKLERCYLSASVILKKLKEFDPQYELNGMRNIWILKPSDLCCGTGISISHCVKDIFRRVEAKPKDYFIVQKYIEKPLLIHDTKFDIRLWYLITSTFPLTIWIFDETLLRFSSKPYNFVTYHEAIHLCNTAIQQKYDYEKRRRRRRGNLDDETTDSIRDQGWDCAKLNEYLKTLGHKGEPYYEIIYPGMCQAIVLTMLAAQEHLDRRTCSFELFGADFMVMDDLSVWLIEINTNPRMHPPSSMITQRLYNAVLESLVKGLWTC
ncbi:hypothetical protein PV325_009824, partial [Microctonus aethiopoides]